MKYQEHSGTYLLRLMPGEELIETLTKFCKDKYITGGSITGLGGTTDATLHYFDIKANQYNERKFNDGALYEVANLSGNISVEKIHIHITIADKNLQAYAGHCGAVVADPTLEVTIIPLPETHRTLDEATGLALLDLPQSTT